MKQQITLTELRELTDDQRARLRVLWKPRTGDICYPMEKPEYDLSYDYSIVLGNMIHDVPDGDFHPIGHAFKDYLPLLSIGQIIEFLNSDLEEMSFDPENNQWVVKYKETYLSHPELVIALWGVLKHLMEEH
jgi:hypothetical protein